MENATIKMIEFQQSSTPKKLSSQSPCLDLPIPITELILERLPLPDYIRFGSVCTKWHSIQKQHRIHHSPLPPPMQKSFPWLITRFPEERQTKLLPCYSPLEQKSFPLSIHKSRYKTIFSASASSHGWFFLVDIDHRKKVSLYNPVSKSQIKLPPLMASLSTKVKGFLSASPFSPDCVVFILDDNHYKAFLYRLGQRQSKWTMLDVPYELDLDFDRHTDCVYCNGNFYCIGEDFFLIDSVYTTPTINELVMDCSQLPSEEYDHDQTLVESNGEVLLVVYIYNQSYTRLESLDVFKADFFRMVWVRIKNIGDHALFVATEGSFSVLADDVGCKSNCMYFNCVYFMKYVKSQYIKWSVFDMDTMRWGDGPPRCEDGKQFGYVEQWFLPSLDYNV